MQGARCAERRASGYGLAMGKPDVLVRSVLASRYDLYPNIALTGAPVSTDAQGDCNSRLIGGEDLPYHLRLQVA